MSARWQGLGPRSRERLAAIGIDTPDRLRSSDAFDVYASIKPR
ncbi:hypothetical protein J2X16_002659 [Pelomonas aquatica]|uniref:Uncharacterized protein n=1 Tax=Pelomonas aquatica TaxID=431058 RepID=A0ABU1Z9N5_9BURK|nr:hypothetical protein [Pelomonas aquatica]